MSSTFLTIFLYESVDMEMLTVTTDDGAKSLASKDLGKWRPQVLKESQESGGMAEFKVEN